jgi:hypothetical protein
MEKEVLRGFRDVREAGREFIVYLEMEVQGGGGEAWGGEVIEECRDISLDRSSIDDTTELCIEICQIKLRDRRGKIVEKKSMLGVGGVKVERNVR